MNDIKFAVYLGRAQASESGALYNLRHRSKKYLNYDRRLDEDRNREFCMLGYSFASNKCNHLMPRKFGISSSNSRTNKPEISAFAVTHYWDIERIRWNNDFSEQPDNVNRVSL